MIGTTGRRDVPLLAWMSSLGVHQVGPGRVSFEMPLSHRSGGVKEIMNGEGFYREVSGLGIEMWDFLLVGGWYLKSRDGWEHFNSAPDTGKTLA